MMIKLSVALFAIAIFVFSTSLALITASPHNKLRDTSVDRPPLIGLSCFDQVSTPRICEVTPAKGATNVSIPSNLDNFIVIKYSAPPQPVETRY
jgi:hypothetical protein